MNARCTNAPSAGASGCKSRKTPTTGFPINRSRADEALSASAVRRQRNDVVLKPLLEIALAICNGRGVADKRAVGIDVRVDPGIAGARADHGRVMGPWARFDLEVLPTVRAADPSAVTRLDPVRLLVLAFLHGVLPRWQRVQVSPRCRDGSAALRSARPL